MKYRATFERFFIHCLMFSCFRLCAFSNVDSFYNAIKRTNFTLSSISSCHLTKLDDVLSRLYSADDDVVSDLKTRPLLNADYGDRIMG